MATAIPDNVVKEHENNLTEIYKKLFGFYSSSDEDVKKEIETEAINLAKELSKENVRLFTSLNINNKPTTK